ncbi:hypothetical protein VdG2_02592 [Verticillium dahliae VDG2]|nr:hypothetical protein VdG2_02592 [Verticillium dahliae VDG2]
MPDLNSVPASPHALTSSRRPSSNQLPAHNLDILPSNQTTVNQPRRASNASLPSPHLPPGQPQPTTANISAPSDIGVVSGPGPIRHPRPLTAADLHIQLEKEQEAVVNRLTRELQLLRAAHNASTVSNASSTSTGNTATEQPTPPVDAGLLSGAGFSTAGRRHNRTSSSTSARSLMATMGSANASTTSIPMRSAPNASLSRQNSSASHPSLAGTSPAAADLIAGPGYFPSSQRVPSQVATSAGTLATPAETLLHREQLETALQENEALKRRIRELERLSIAGSVGVGVPEEEVKVGESASNAGLAQGV